MSAALVRVWAAILVDGHPRLDVRDFYEGDADPVDGPDYRIFRWQRLDTRPRTEPDESCTGGKMCGPLKPCRACIETAARWWFEWQDRTDARKWRATSETPGQKHWALREWCPHEKGHADEAAAPRCARKHGFPRVVQMDGHGARLRWVDVALPAAAAPLFAAGGAS